MTAHEDDMRQMRERGNVAAIVLALTLAMAWPAILFGSFGYSWDSSGYYRGGRVAVQFALGRPTVAHIAKREPSRAAATGATQPKPLPADGGRGNVGGLRSIAYSVAAYMLSLPGVSLAPLVCVQLVAMLALVYGLLEFRDPARRLRAALAATLALGLGSTLPVYATLATPDVLAGAMIAALAALTSGSVRGRAARAWLATLIVASITAHQSHVGLALAALVLAVVYLSIGLRRRRLKDQLRVWSLPVVAIIAGLTFNVASSVVGFGEVSVTPKHYPFALARSVEDGPARWYLESACSKRHYAICELYPSKIPSSNFEFLWGSNGIAARATPAQMDRIRSEEPEIVAAALAAYPFYQLNASLLNFWKQISMIGVDPAIYQATRLDASGEAITEPIPASRPWLVALQRAGLVISLMYLAACWHRLNPQGRRMIVVTVSLILANSAICGVISAPDIRYQNRALWVIVLIATKIALDRTHFSEKFVPKLDPRNGASELGARLTI